MKGIRYLSDFDPAQLWRFFVDGRFHNKYHGWKGYDDKERGSVQAMLNGFSCMINNFDLSGGLNTHYISILHKNCMSNVKTENNKSTPGELRFLNSGMPIFNKSGSIENIVELLKIRNADGTQVFNTKPFDKEASELDANEIFTKLQSSKRINYKPWYPTLDNRLQGFLLREGNLVEYYEAKYYVQKLFAQKIDHLIVDFNQQINSVILKQDKLPLISNLVRDLELLHPFPDGNCRVFASILLNHLLLFHDMPPSILENPNLDGEVSYAQFETEVVKGIENTRLLLKDKKALLFNYSITSMPKKEVITFLEMASEFTSKIKALADSQIISHTDNIYLTPDILQIITDGKWFNYNSKVRFLGVGSHTTVGKGFLYYCFVNDWKKQNKNIQEELSNIIKRGAAAIVIDDISYVQYLGIPILMVDDVEKAMEKVAIETRREIACDSVLVTGTVGKTSYKFQLYHCLKRQIRVHTFLNSINTKIPVIRTLSSLKENDQLEIAELSVGSSHSAVKERSHWIAPNVCVFTDMGPIHMNIHKTVDRLVQAKATAVAGLKVNGFCIINSDAEYYPALLNEIKKQNSSATLYTFGSSDKADAYIIDSQFDSHSYSWNLRASIDGEIIDYKIPLFQQYAPIQSLAVLLVVKKLGYDMRQAAKDYELDFDIFESMGRLFRLDLDKKKVLFYDQSYRGSIQGMRSAFKDINNLAIKGRKIFVIGGTSVEEDSDYTKEQHTEVAEMINDAKIDKLFTTGPYVNYIHDNLYDNSILVGHSDDLGTLAIAIQEEIKDGDFLFIMGSGYLYLGRLGKKLLDVGQAIRLR